MGEYGTPNIDIEEGWIDIEHNGRGDRFLFPRQGGSLYHTTKILDTDLLWFYVRTYGLRVTVQVPIEVAPNGENLRYLRAKREKLGHRLHHQDLKFEPESDS